MNNLDAATQSPLDIGTALGSGRYILQSKLSDAPPAWTALDDFEDRPVVLRFLPPEIQQDPRAVEELRRQVELCRELDHPHIARALELVTEMDEPAFLVLERVEGRTLAALQQEQPGKIFTWQWLEPRVIQICQALQYAHGRGVVHGAIQPENILINRVGNPMLIHHAVSGVLANPLHSGLTNQQALVYLSPQILQGLPPQASDDIYSLAITLYRALSGTTPFYGGELLSQIRNAAPTPLEARLNELRILNPVPLAVSRFMLSALSKNPEVRPQDLSALTHSHPIPAPTPIQSAPARPAPSAQPVQPQPIAAQPVPAQPVTAPAAAAPSLKLAKHTAPASLHVEPAKGLEPANPAQRMQKALKKDSRRRILAVAGIAALLLVAGAVVWFLKDKVKVVAEAKERPIQTSIAALTSQPKAPVEKVPASSKSAVQSRLPLPTAQVLPTVEQKPGDADKGFETVFNGRDLAGWTGDSKYWSVKDGAIVGMLRSDVPLKMHTYLVLDRGTMADFEFRFSFRNIAFQHNSQPNAGVQYRAIKSGNSGLRGYQFDIVRDVKDLGAIMDDQARRRLAGLGTRAVATMEDGKDVVNASAEVTPANVITEAWRKDDWNEGVIIARGNRLVHKLNGRIVAELTDEHPAKSHKSGLLALELYGRNTNNPALFIQFKDLRLKRLDGTSGAQVASRAN